MTDDHHKQTDDLSDRISLLADACLIGGATDAQCAELEQLVTTDEQARRQYVQYVQDTLFLHDVALRDWVTQDNLTRGGITFGDWNESRDRSLSARETKAESGACALEFDDHLADHSGELSLPPVVATEAGSENRMAEAFANAPMPHTTKRRLTRLLAFSTVAASVLFGAFSWWKVKTTVPERVAVLNQAKGVVWRMNDEDVSIARGDWMMNGRYTLVEGIAQLTFPWGTELTIEAPAQIELQPGNVRQLFYGQVVAKVSQDDSGFTIDTPTVKVVDLGTEFGVSVDQTGSSEVHVFKGEVEVRQPDGRHILASQQPLLLTAGHATRFDSAHPQQVTYNPKRFVKAWREASHVKGTAGGVRFVHPQPARVMEGESESNEAIVMFLERERVTLPDVTAVTLTQPGLYTTFAERSALLPPGLEVDSYLLHFDPVGSDESAPTVSAEGTVTFDRPILGIIARGDQLSASDGVCAHPGTQYLGRSLAIKPPAVFQVRGLVGVWNSDYLRTTPAPNDRIRFSLDRKTLSLQLSAGGEADQIRILVAAAGTEPPVMVESPSVGPPRPFHGQPFLVNDTIEAEDFDLGGEGVAWFDVTPNSVAQTYRLGVGVELGRYQYADDSADEAPTYAYVGGARSGEWLAYTVDIKKAGTYTIKSSVWSHYGGGTFHVEFDEYAKSDAVVIPNVAKPGHEWAAEVDSGTIELKAGVQVMRVVMDEQHVSGWVGNIDWLRIEPVDSD